MTDFLEIKSNYEIICEEFNEQVVDSFGQSISNEVLEPVEMILNSLMSFEDNEKKVKLMQINQLLMEAKSILQ